MVAYLVEELGRVARRSEVSVPVIARTIRDVEDDARGERSTRPSRAPARPTFAHVSLRVTVRLSTMAPGRLSGSTQK
jgi:hypothetical protein